MKFTGPTSKTKGNNVNVIKKNKSFFFCPFTLTLLPFLFNSLIQFLKKNRYALPSMERIIGDGDYETASDNVVLKRLMDQIDIDLEGVNRIPAQTNEDIIR